ncbi:MAG: TetR/AcrR family transcriptional regulator [Thermoanaerobaculia bacterium]|nr:MAG: TetR/AcrR family transcriptional regulator [Thermoanaerobaculia bacterium]
MTHSHQPLTLVPFEPTPRQREILEHAFELVQQSGLTHLTLRKVAERVGFTEAAIYRHFPSKAALVDALVRTLGGRLLGPIRELAADLSVPPSVRLERMVRHHVGILRATGGLPIILVAEGLATGDTELMDRLRSVMSAYVGLLAGVLAEIGLPAGVPPAQQALLFIGLPAALGMQLRAFPDLALTDPQADELVGYYVRALTGAARDRAEVNP